MPQVTGPLQYELVINCINSINENASYVAKEIDRSLADSEANMEEITIVNSPLEFVPPSNFYLTRLIFLRLSDNRLTSLPLGCFNNMTNLTSLDVSNNRLLELQMRTMSTTPIDFYYVKREK